MHMVDFSGEGVLPFQLRGRRTGEREHICSRTMRIVGFNGGVNFNALVMFGKYPNSMWEIHRTKRWIFEPVVFEYWRVTIKMKKTCGVCQHGEFTLN